MINTIITTLLGTTLMINTMAVSPVMPVSQVALTKYLPQKHTVSKPIEKKPVAVAAKPKIVTPAPTQAVLPTIAPVVTQAVAKAAPTNFDAVYKDAGAKYGIPWQILYGLHMTESGGRDGAISSGHGPQGPMQFMPGTWNAYGVDGNGDGTADINNAVDAIHGAANYLAKHGSLDNALRAYGCNKVGTLNYARQMGYAQ